MSKSLGNGIDPIEIIDKYGAEDLGSEYGEKWWKEKIAFFYPGNMR